MNRQTFVFKSIDISIIFDILFYFLWSNYSGITKILHNMVFIVQSLNITQLKDDLPPSVARKSCPILAFWYFTDDSLHNVSITGS